MFYLLFAITLNSLHKALHRLVLFNFQMVTVPLHSLKHFLLIYLYFDLFLFVAFCSHELGIIILLHTEENLFLVSERYKVFTCLKLELSSDFIDKVSLLVLLFHPKLFNKFKGCSFVVRHVFVPGIWKLLELKFLCVFYVEQFFLLCDSHVLLLTLLLSSGKLVKLVFHLSSASVVT